jgi:Holliday junction resolvasome RuvABC DNA-binding subunit
MKYSLNAMIITCMVLSTSSAFASHYYLTDVDSFEREKIILLTQNKIQTTEQFLQASITREQRKQLSEYLDISERDLTDFALSCELMQIQGVGPKVVNLLKSSGINSLMDLSSKNAEKLFDVVISVNKEKKITNKQPTLDLVEYWIEQSKKVPFRVEL